jgi:hypothetical protein
VSHLYFIPVFAFSMIVGACSKTPFERAHEQAVAHNPAGIELKIRTIDGSKTLHVGDPVRFEELYTSKYPGWHIEVLDGWNEASTAETIFVSDGKSIWNAPERPRAIVCCDSRHVWLSLDPTRLPYWRPASNNFRSAGYRRAILPNLPGKYQLYVATERVFNQDYATATYHGKGLAVTSDNILALEVVK